MILTILGGGGFRVPLVYQAVAAARSRVDVSEVVLLDADPDRLTVMSHVLQQLGRELGEPGAAPAVRATTDLDEAVTGADVIFSAIRVGGTTGRTRDERTALAEGLLGQETVGPGGLAYALRTVPEVDRVAARIAALAPGAWTISFTNPASIVTEAMRSHLGERVVGICDTPIALVRRALLGCGLDPAAFDRGEAEVDYAGLNHLGWLQGLRAGGTDHLPGLLADDAALADLEEARLMGADWLRATGALPNEYLYYYDFTREAVAGIAAQERTRGEFLQAQQGAFYDAATAEPARALELWRATLAEREATYMATERETQQAGERAAADLGGGYHEVAVDLMAALLGGEEHRMILDVANTATDGQPLLTGLPADAVVEVPVRVDADGVHPLPVARQLPPERLALVAAVKACERLIIDAARTRSRRSAWLAFAHHPLVDSAGVAHRLVEACWPAEESGEQYGADPDDA
ncbi:family 4 glycosyl hydrolase [Georgenia subflava]|uniref:6-phospho-beta-glucosidase n=1 Tax=Georgenia subflava TaxID=1622177 RepID=A0A6N7EM71_9MICO|nr:6-phospho-beta-glucosidase [Georgenia subflava]MPV38173.1 6-phospho-beta-glucosidase [Georgenia subflava]